MVTLVAKPAQKGKAFVGWQSEKGEIVIGTAEPTYTYYASESLALTAVYANAPYEWLSGGAIAGIVAGGVAFVSLGCSALVRHQKEILSRLVCSIQEKNNKIKKRRFLL